MTELEKRGGDLGVEVRADEGGKKTLPAITFAPVIDARGADVAAVARLEQVVARQQAEFDVRVQKIVRSRGKKWID